MSISLIKNKDKSSIIVESVFVSRIFLMASPMVKWRSANMRYENVKPGLGAGWARRGQRGRKVHM